MQPTTLNLIIVFNQNNIPQICKYVNNYKIKLAYSRPKIALKISTSVFLYDKSQNHT